MRRYVLSVARFVLLAGPVALAFFAGGYFDTPRAWAGLVVWILVATAILAGAGLPRGRGQTLALLGLGLLAAWTLLSTFWAPIAGSAYHAGQRVVLYVGALVAAAALLRDRRAQQAVEPALALGALIVVGYGLSERFLPGLLTFQHSVTAQGRLEQPLTYWNAMGEVAAIGLVLCARLVGDPTRSLRLRAAGAAASAPLGMGLYLTFSRGALFAYAAGLVALLVFVQRREQLRGAVLSIAAGTLGALAAAPFPGVVGLRSSASSRAAQGLTALVLLAIIMAIAAVATIGISRGERTGKLRLPRRTPLIALVVILAGLGIAIVVGAKENTTVPLTARTARFVTLRTSRYSNWAVALRAFSDEPIRGVGAGGWAVYWLRYRPTNEFSQDAHSLPIQTLAELGIVGLALLLAFLAGIALAARDALRASPSLAAGPVAGFVVWLAHSPLDWDWEMPAVTLMALLLAGAIVALAESTTRTTESLASGSLEDPQRLASEDLSTETGFTV